MFNKLFLTKNEFEAYNKTLKTEIPTYSSLMNEKKSEVESIDERDEGSESKEMVSMSTPYRPSSRPSSLLISEIESGNNFT